MLYMCFTYIFSIILFLRMCFMFKNFISINPYFVIIFFMILAIILSTYYGSTNPNYSFFISDGSEFVWPLPGHNTITYYFGFRKAPTAYASTYHSGIDIAASERHTNCGMYFWHSNNGKILWFWRIHSCY